MQGRAQLCILKLYYPAGRKGGFKLGCTDSDPGIKQTIKITCSRFHSGQTSRYNGFLEKIFCKQKKKGEEGEELQQDLSALLGNILLSNMTAVMTS